MHFFRTQKHNITQQKKQHNMTGNFTFHIPTSDKRATGGRRAVPMLPVGYRTFTRLGLVDIQRESL